MSSAPKMWVEYPLQGSRLDLPLSNVLHLNDANRIKYIKNVLDALSKEIDNDTMALKPEKSFKPLITDYRKVLRLPAGSYLVTEDDRKRNVLAFNPPGRTHSVHSRTNMWRMATNSGSLEENIRNHAPSLVNKLTKLIDPNNKSKEGFRAADKSAIKMILRFMQLDYSVGTAFPPFHAKFFADRFLPTDGDCLIVDPCAGWGGRLLGSLCVKREGSIHYVGIDPETRNKEAYEMILGIFKKYLLKEAGSERDAEFHYKPFEDWIKSARAKELYGKTDLVITSPPYFDAEVYNTKDKNQSANRYDKYELWKKYFYKEVVNGAYKLLKPGGVFVLNIANVKSAPYLERDARELAREAGFENGGFFKMTMAIPVGTRSNSKKQSLSDTKKKKRAKPHRLYVDGKEFKYEPCFVFAKPIGKKKAPIKPLKKKTVSTKSSAVKKNSTKKLSWETTKELYRNYDKQCSDSFKRIKKTDKVNFVFHDGEPVCGYVLSRRKAKGEECLYRGKKRTIPCIEYQSGDYEITKFSCFSKSKDSVSAVIKEIKSLKTPCAVEVLSTSLPEKRILKSAGFINVASSVNSHGDIYHIYLSSDIANQRKIQIDEIEKINIKKLKVSEISDLVKSIDKKLDANIKDYSNHPSNYNKNNTWEAIALRGYLPDPLYIESLEENAAYQEKENAAWLKKFSKSQRGLQDTPLLKKFPEVQKLLDALIPHSSKNNNAQFKRVRLMKLAPLEGELERHTDLTDKSLGLTDGNTVRLHVPIRTNEKAIVTSWDIENQPHQVNMRQGELWYLNIRLPHKVINDGKKERIHLVIDVIVDDKIRQMIRGESKPLIKDDNYYLGLIKNWNDPYPSRKLEKHNGFNVVRDDYLDYGSKCRFIDYMVKNSKEKEFVFGASNKVGWGAISLSAVCARYGKKAVFFMAHRKEPTEHQQAVIDLGGKIEWVQSGMLNVTQARAREYAQEKPNERRLLPIGLEDDTVIASIIKVARALPIKTKEIWTVASSGTLSRGLQLAFPDAKVFAVQTGHSLSKEQQGRATLIKSPYAYDKPVKPEDAPPYPSEPYYDAKLWQVVVKKASKGALIWNVAKQVAL